MWIFRDSTQVYLSSQKYFNALDVMIFSKKSPSCKLKRQSNRTQIAILNVAVFVDYDVTSLQDVSMYDLVLASNLV